MTAKEIYIEKVGLFYEKYGLSKMAGRILGCLLSSETDFNSFDYLIDSLKASKGSISGNVKVLLTQGLIIKHTRSGDRKSYYKTSLNSLENILAAKIKSISEFKALFKEANNLKKEKESENYKTIENVIAYYTFLESEIPNLKKKWDDQQKNK